MLKGSVEHRDSNGRIGDNAGDIPWMTDGEWIVHQEIGYDTGEYISG